MADFWMDSFDRGITATTAYACNSCSDALSSYATGVVNNYITRDEAENLFNKMIKSLPNSIGFRGTLGIFNYKSE